MLLEIVSPEATLFSDEVESVTVPGVKGEFQMLNNHAPIVSLLGEGIVKIRSKGSPKENQAHRFSRNSNGDLLLSINSGTVELMDNKIILLAD